MVPKKKKKANKGPIESEGDGGSAQTAQAQPSTRTQPSTRVQQSVRAQPNVQAQPSVRAQPSASAGHSTAQTIPRAPRRVELQALGPADNSHIQEGGALRRGSAFPRGFRLPGPGPFRIRRSNEARAWDFEPSRSYIQHADIQANDPDWEEPELPWNPVTMGRFEGKQRTFTTSAKKFPGAQFIVKQAAEGRSLASTLRKS